MTLVRETSAAAPSQLRGGGRRREHRRQGGSARPGLRRRVASRLLTALIVAAVLFLALLSLPRLVGYGTLVVRSGSMEQTAPVGSLVVARPLEAADVRVGDVILVRRDGPAESAPVLHRVVSLIHRGAEIEVTTKGDSNAAPDRTPFLLRGPTMTPVLAVPHVGQAFDFVRSPLGWTGLIALPATALLCAQLRTIWLPAPRRGPHRSPASHAPALHRAASRRSAAHRHPRRGRTGRLILNDDASAAE
jgi:signal peptidase I